MLKAWLIICLMFITAANGIADIYEGPQTTGACCHSDGTCTIMTQANCLAQPGAWYVGDNINCLGDNNSNGIDEICETDTTLKWEQLPDLDSTGMDISAYYQPGLPPYLLADDFLCEQTGPITKIEIWGSWWQDELPDQPIAFILSFHSDIPAAENPYGDYSMPGDLLWLDTLYFAYMFLYAENLEEGWFEPPDNYNPIGETQCYMFRFTEFDDPFIQQGSPANPVVYWLDIQLIPLIEPAFFGWKTSVDHWNDDAVWIDSAEPLPPDPSPVWNELRYPDGHPWHPQSIDLAFRIYGLEGPATGACCFPDGSCSDLLAVDCANAGGIWSGYGTSCQGDNDGNLIDDACEGLRPTGACCLTDQSCVVTYQTVCETVPGAIYMGDGSDCSDNSGNSIADICEDITGACCLPDGDCLDLNGFDCLNYGGIWGGFGSFCMGDTDSNYIDEACEGYYPMGACCLPDQSCFVTYQDACVGFAAGDYKGDGTDCSDGDGDGIADICEPLTGACCLTNGSCINGLLNSECFNAGGTWAGEGTSCLGDGDGNYIDDACEIYYPLGACCLQDQTCIVTYQPACETVAGGTYVGDFTDCSDLNGNSIADICEEDTLQKWLQTPDLDPTGMDITASQHWLLGQKILADDFECNRTGRITEITIWGSWNGDIMPVDPPAFILSFHADIPANQNPHGNWSMPGELLWLDTLSVYEEVLFADNLAEGWFNPPDIYMPNADTQCWMYRFTQFDEPFIQQGTPENPIIYWLDVQCVLPYMENALFGWKTSLDHWNDDAVWIAGVEPLPIDPLPMWNEMIYPIEHPMYPQSIDLAFEILSLPQVPPPDINVTPDTLGYEQCIETDSIYTAQFQICNTGTGPLIVSGITCDLGFVSIVNAMPITVPSTGCVDIDIRINTTGMSAGTYVDSIRIDSDDPDTPILYKPKIVLEVTEESTWLAYLAGDVNMFNGAWPPQAIGGDVTYLVNYFRGVETSHSCLLGGFWCSADANGDCNIIGSDVTRLVNYFRGQVDLLYCPDYEPAWPPVPDEPPAGWPNCEAVTTSNTIPTDTGR